jgi:hypothetical protein
MIFSVLNEIFVASPATPPAKICWITDRHSDQHAGAAGGSLNASRTALNARIPVAEPQAHWMIRPTRRALPINPEPIFAGILPGFIVERRPKTDTSVHRTHDVILTSTAPGWPALTLGV